MIYFGKFRSSFIKLIGLLGRTFILILKIKIVCHAQIFGCHIILFEVDLLNYFIAAIPGRIFRVKGNGWWSGQYRWYYYRCANYRPIVGIICLYRADVPANIVSPIIGLLVLDRCLGYYRSTNLRFIKARPTLSLSMIHQPLIFNIGALVGPSFIDQSLLSQCWTDNQATLDQPIFNFLKLR